MKRCPVYIGLLLTLMVLPAAADAQVARKTTRQYRLSEDFTEVITVPVDTQFILFHRHRITDKFSRFNAYPGNYGLPLYQISFFDRPEDPDMYLYKHYYPFMYVPSRMIFMDTPVPFTELMFTYAGATRNTAEQTFRVRHSQNINRHLNFGLIYDVVYSLGQYAYQKAENKNFLLHGSYIRNRYKAYGAVGINNLYSYENGGVTDPDIIDQFDTRDVPVRLGGLNRAQSTLKNRSFLLVQQYTPLGQQTGNEGDTLSGVTGTFSHILKSETGKRTYFDAAPQSGFYDTAYINTGSTLDSLSSLLVSNSARFDFSFRSKGGFLLNAGGGVIHEYHTYTQLVPLQETGGPDTAITGHQNLAVTGKIENRIGNKFGWKSSGDLYIGGYRAGDFKLGGEIFKDFSFTKGDAELVVKGSVRQTTPSVWFTRWGSNHFDWNITDQAREFSIEAGAAFYYPVRLFEAEFRYSITDNFFYFNDNAFPATHTGALSVAALSIDKTIRLGGFRFGNSLLLQQSSNGNVLSLPLAALRTALWYERNIHFAITGGNLLIEAGAEAFMHTRYNAMAYMPATGRYHNQSSYETGEYPFVNIFLNAKIKRTRFMLCFDHVNSGLMGNNYYLIPLYPLNVRMFRYGIAWTFYD